MAKPSLKPDDPEQSKRFLQMAAELGADGKPEDFDRAFRKIATAKRAPPPTPKKRGKRFELSDAVEFFAGLRIGIDRHGVRGILSPCDDALTQHWELGFGPIDGGFRFDEIGAHG